MSATTPARAIVQRHDSAAATLGGEHVWTACGWLVRPADAETALGHLDAVAGRLALLAAHPTVQAFGLHTTCAVLRGRIEEVAQLLRGDE